MDAGIPSAVLDPVASSTRNLSPPVRFMDVIPLALLGIHTFYGTGHQSAISLFTMGVCLLIDSSGYPLSPITVVLNSVGPIFLMALGTPLLALWNRAPSRTHDSAAQQIKRESTLATLSMMMYYTALLLGASVSATILRRHLMVRKVFAPRFIAAVLELLAVDVAVILGVAVGVQRVAGRTSTMFTDQR